MPEGICGRGIRDLNGVVQLPLVTEWPLVYEAYRWSEVCSPLTAWHAQA